MVNFTAAERECLSGEFLCVGGTRSEGRGGGGGGEGGEGGGENGKNSNCVAYFLRCDGSADCINGTDELDCELSKLSKSGNESVRLTFRLSFVRPFGRFSAFLSVFRSPLPPFEFFFICREIE